MHIASTYSSTYIYLNLSPFVLCEFARLLTPLLLTLAACSCRGVCNIRQHTSAYISMRQHASAYVSMRQHASAYVSMRQHALACISICQHTSAYVSMRQRTSAYVSMRQHASAYVRIRQHASACVNIRQHTSAYVNIRQHPSALLLTCRGVGNNKSVRGELELGRGSFVRDRVAVGELVSLEFATECAELA